MAGSNGKHHQSWKMMPHCSLAHATLNAVSLGLGTQWYLLLSALTTEYTTCINILSALSQTGCVHLKEGRQQACQSCQLRSLGREKWSHLTDSFRKTNLRILNSQTFSVCLVCSPETDLQMKGWQLRDGSPSWRKVRSIRAGRWPWPGGWEAKLALRLASTTHPASKEWEAL